MRSPVRTIHGYYDFEGSGAVNKDAAIGLVETSAAIMSRYTGRIAVAGVKGLRIPERLQPFDPRKVAVERTAPHSLIVTRRELVSDDLFADSVAALADGGKYARVGELCFIAPDGSWTKTTVSQLPPHRDLTGSYALADAVHGLAHSFMFNQEHCASPACIMHLASIVDLGVPNPAIASGNPFCDNCAGDLELAGYSALATELKS